MKLYLLLLLIEIIQPHPVNQTFTTQSTGYRKTAYFINWGIYARNFQPANVPFDKLTHIHYAFAKPNEDGSISLGDSYADTDKAYPGDSWDTTIQPYRGCFWQLNRVWKKKYPVKVLLSVGGWTWSGAFSVIAGSQQLRNTFAQSCVALIQKYDFDGIDLDWEYPVEGGLGSNHYSPDDGKNYVLLLQAIRQAFSQLADYKELTIAAPAGPHLTRHLLIQEMSQYLDAVNIMTYDFRGGWSQYTGHHTPLYGSSTDPDPSLTDTQAVVQYYLQQGMPAGKISIGAALYGRGWLGASSTNHGLFQTFSSLPRGTWDDGSSGLTGVFDYKQILAQLNAGQFVRYWDSEVHAPWLYDQSSQLMISYDDKQSVGDKVQFVKQLGLGGIMFWEMSGDDQQESLIQVANLGLSGGTVPIISSSSSVISATRTSSSAISSTSSSASKTTATSTSSVGACQTNVPTSCTFGTQDTCINGQYAQCYPDNTWHLVQCAQGTYCQMTNGFPMCQWGTFTCGGATSSARSTSTSSSSITRTSSSISRTITSSTTKTSTSSSTQASPTSGPCQTRPDLLNKPCQVSDQPSCYSPDAYLECNFGIWQQRQCAPGTKCFNQPGSGVICTFPNAFQC